MIEQRRYHWSALLCRLIQSPRFQRVDARERGMLIGRWRRVIRPLVFPNAVKGWIE